MATTEVPPSPITMSEAGANSLTTTEAAPTSTAPVDRSVMTDETRHRFLAYLMPQLEPLRQSCEQNWLIQAVLITLGAFQLYNPTMATGVASALRIPVDSFDAVIPLVLTYLFIRFGYLLNAYLFIRDGISRTIEAFSVRPAVFELEQRERMFSSNSLVELFCLDYNRKRFRFSRLILGILPLMVAAIFALNHRLVFLYLDRLVGHRPTLLIIIKSFIAVVLGFCYLHFIVTTNRTGARVVAALSIIFTLVFFIVIRR